MPTPESVVIFDANVLPIASNLESALWVSILRLCERAQIRPCIPIVVLHESVNIRREKYADASSKFLAGFKALSRFFEAPSVYIPDASEIAQRWESELRANFEVLDSDGDDSAEALRREATRYPPARLGKGGRDSLIWLTAIRLAREGAHVHLVSRNTADFSSGDAKSSLHPVLAAERNGLAGLVSYHIGLDEFIEAVATRSAPPVFRTELVTDVLADELRDSVLQQLFIEGDLALILPEDQTTASIRVEEIEVLRSYAFEDGGLALLSGDGVASLVDDSSEAALRVPISFQAWIDFDLGTMEPASGEVRSVTCGAPSIA